LKNFWKKKFLPSNPNPWPSWNKWLNGGFFEGEFGEKILTLFEGEIKEKTQFGPIPKKLRQNGNPKNN